MTLKKPKTIPQKKVQNPKQIVKSEWFQLNKSAYNVISLNNQSRHFPKSLKIKKISLRRHMKNADFVYFAKRFISKLVGRIC